MSTHLATIGLRGAWESALLALFIAALFRLLPALQSRRGSALAGVAFALAVALPFCPTVVFASQTGSAIPPAYSLLLPARVAANISGAWLLLSSALLLRLALSAFALARLLRAAEPAPPALLALHRTLTHGRASRARLLLADGLLAPGACGLLRPAILLPRALPAALAEQDLAAVLRHEAAHLNQGDDWLVLALRFARALVPFAFGAAWLQRRILDSREMACDQAALRAGSSPRSYAACLARLAERALPANANALALGLVPRPGGAQLSLRINSILAGNQPDRGPGKLRSAAAALAGLALCLGLLIAPSVFSFEQAPATAPLAEAPPLPLSFPSARIRPASLQLSPASKPAAPRKHRLAHHKPTQRVLVIQTVFFAAPQPRVLVLLPAAQALPAQRWPRFFFLSL